MKTKIFAYALISSPLLALFGASPFYIFGVLNLEQSAQMHVSVLLSVAFYWAINGYLFLKAKQKRAWYIFLLSYFLTFFSNVLKAPFQSFVQFRSVVEEYLVYPIISTIALNTIILLIIHLIIGEEEKQKAQSTISELTIKKLEAENQSLMQQLQPHFLFNALSILKSLIKENADLAEAYIIKLSDFLRYTVESHNTELVSIKEEMQFVHNYVELQKVRFENAVKYEVHIPDKVLRHKVPVLAIQTLVENAFKHNYFTEKRPLTIQITYESGVIEVQNNIVSLKVTERAGTGLANLEKRYDIIAGQKIEVNRSEDSFSVKIPVVEA